MCCSQQLIEIGKVDSRPVVLDYNAFKIFCIIYIKYISDSEYLKMNYFSPLSICHLFFLSLHTQYKWVHHSVFNVFPKIILKSF